LGTTWTDAYRIGPDRGLIGKPVASASVGRHGDLTAKVEDADELSHVDLEAPLSPTNVVGRLSGGDPAGHDLAFAVNGKIVTTAVSFKGLGTRHLNFSTMLPTAALRPGRNELKVYEIDGTSLVPL